MPDKPIIFSAPMIRALLAGRKTQTRRVLKPQPPEGSTFFAYDMGDQGFFARFAIEDDAGNVDLPAARLPYAPGDRLWVKERWRTVSAADDRYTPAELGWQGGACLVHDATDETQTWNGKTRSPIHMPRWASRMTLGVTEVKVQRLQGISAVDIAAEGACEFALLPPTDDEAFEARTVFHDLWNSLHGPDAWDANSWVCALTFTVHRCNIDQMER